MLHMLIADQGWYRLQEDIICLSIMHIHMLDRRYASMNQHNKTPDGWCPLL